MKIQKTILFIMIGMCVVVVLALIARVKVVPHAQQFAISDASDASVLSDARASLSAKDMPLSLDIPEGTGHLVEAYTAQTSPAARTLIHIQDIHTNYEAQKNSSKMIEAFFKQHQVRLILVEGGWGNVSLSYLRAYADAGRRQEVAEEYLKQGQISGEEYLDIVSDYDILLEGIEDELLYQANLDTFFMIEEFRVQAAQELAQLQSVINALKNKMYTPQLLELEKTKHAYDAEQITLAEYYQYLSVVARKTGQEMARYPHFARFMDVVAAEAGIQFSAVEKERSALIERLSQKLSQHDLSALVARSLEFRLNKLTPLQYHEYLLQSASTAGEPTNKYPHLGKYMEYIRSHNAIDTAKLFEEAEQLHRVIEDSYTKDPMQRQLCAIDRSAQVLHNFLHLKLVPDDFIYYKANSKNFATTGWVDFLMQQAQRYKLHTNNIVPALVLDENLPTLVRFYDLANERDNAFVANTIALMERESASTAILIAGGFHTPNLKQKFQDKGLSYIIVAPYTTQQTDPEQYRHILKYKSGKEQANEK
jgi:hypothetical protein